MQDPAYRIPLKRYAIHIFYPFFKSRPKFQWQLKDAKKIFSSTGALSSRCYQYNFRMTLIGNLVQGNHQAKPAETMRQVSIKESMVFNYFLQHIYIGRGIKPFSF